MTTLKVFSLLSVFLVLAGCNLNPDRFSTEPVEIKLQGHKFIVPRNYLVSDSHLNMRLLLPEFEPRTRQNEHIIDTSRKGRVIEIRFSAQVPEGSRVAASYEAGNLEYQKKRLKVLREARTKKSQKPLLGNPDVLSDTVAKYPSNETTGWKNDVYVFSSDEAESFILECNSNIETKAPANPQCISKNIIFGNIKMVYWYPTHFLKDAERIHGQIRKLLTEFRERS